MQTSKQVEGKQVEQVEGKQVEGKRAEQAEHERFVKICVNRAIRFVLCKGFMPANCRIHQSCTISHKACNYCKAVHNMGAAAFKLLDSAMRGVMRMLDVNEFKQAKEAILIAGTVPAGRFDTFIYVQPLRIIEFAHNLRSTILVDDDQDELRQICAAFINMHHTYNLACAALDQCGQYQQQNRHFATSSRLQMFLSERYSWIEHNRPFAVKETDGETGGKVESEKVEPTANLKTDEKPDETVEPENKENLEVNLKTDEKANLEANLTTAPEKMTVGEIRCIVGAYEGVNGNIYGNDLRHFKFGELCAMCLTVEHRMATLFNVPVEKDLARTLIILQRNIRFHEVPMQGVPPQFSIGDILRTVSPKWSADGTKIRGRVLSYYTMGQLRSMLATLNQRLAIKLDEDVEETLTFAKVLIMREISYGN